MALMLLQIISILLNVIWWIIIVQAVLSWLIAFNVINTNSDIVRQIWMTLDRMTDPIYRPIRAIMPNFGALDLSPMVVLVLLSIFQQAVLPYIARLVLSA